MKKLKLKRKGFGFEVVVEGEITIDESKIKSYDEYVQNEKAKLVKEELTSFLDSIMPTCVRENNVNLYDAFNITYGAQRARDELVTYLLKNLDLE